ncbi:MAG: response regulator [Deltaproteobacteria bacterium]|nr:MAG: response regulator [Deltaproteobacteria bacterium]
MHPNPRILIVDDEPFNVDYLEQELEELDLDTLSAFNGVEALEQIEAHKPDLVLLDIMMPVMDGFEVLERLKNSPYSNIPVIVISAMSDIDSVAKGITLGAEDYLPKPFDPVLLEARIQASLEKKRLRDKELDYLEQVERLTQAALAIENNNFAPESLDHVAERQDALGRLARIFQSMAKEIYERERRLLHRLERIQTDAKESQQAAKETPGVYIPADRKYALVQGIDLPESTSGAALFVDISGFTRLTEALAKEMGLQRGAEELMRHLNQTYEMLVGHVHEFGGSILNFTGDAISCWFDESLPQGAHSASWRATSAAWAMQHSIRKIDTIVTPSGTPFPLAIKCAVVKGNTKRFLVGNPSVQSIEVMAGDALHTLALGEFLAAPNETLVHVSACEELQDSLLVSEWRQPDNSEHQFAVLSDLKSSAPPAPWPPIPEGALTPEQLKPWLLDPVYHRVHTGQSNDLSELRTVTALFLKFSGIDYENDPQASTKLSQFISWVQDVVLAYDGYVLQFSTGDKGSYLYATFGAPVACEDDAVLAVSAAQSLRVLPAHLSFVTSLQMGLARGLMRTGPYGSPQRRTYGAVGDKTNLAARIMMLAQNSILCDPAVYQATKENYAYESLPPIQVKGKKEPVSLFRPSGSTVPMIQSFIDKLPPGPHLTLKVASLVGQVFDLETLVAIYPVEAEQENLAGYVQELMQAGLIQFMPSKSGQIYTFPMPVVRNTAYELMLFAQRRQLHAALAIWLESKHGENLTPHYPSLIYHWEQAEETEKVLHFLELAGQAAHEEGEHALALEYLEKAKHLNKRSSLLSAEYKIPVIKPEA